MIEWVTLSRWHTMMLFGGADVARVYKDCEGYRIMLLFPSDKDTSFFTLFSAAKRAAEDAWNYHYLHELKSCKGSSESKNTEAVKSD